MNFWYVFVMIVIIFASKDLVNTYMQNQCKIEALKAEKSTEDIVKICK